MELIPLLSFIGIGSVMVVAILFFVFSKGSRTKIVAKEDIEKGSTVLPEPYGEKNEKDDKPCLEEVRFIDDPKIPLLSAQEVTAVSPECSVSEVDAVIIDLIRQATELPSACLELSHLLRDPEASIREITRLVSTDPVLTASLLRVANSAAVARGRVKSIHKAIMLLGFNQVWLLANQMLTARALRPIARVDDDAMASLWRHGAATFVCTKKVLFTLGLWGTDVASTAMTCSLMHDVGKFLLRGFKPFTNSDISGLMEERQIPIIDGERLHYSIDHTRIGYLLTTYWRLPEEVCSITGYHHYPFSANFNESPMHIRRGLCVVAYGDYLAQVAGFREFDVNITVPNKEAMDVIGAKPPYAALLDSHLRVELKGTMRLIDEACRM